MRQANIFLAVASQYQERSHFDAQNVLETGEHAPFELKDGWKNRLAGTLPHRDNQAIAFVPTLPLAMRGAIYVASYAPSGLRKANDRCRLGFRIQRVNEKVFIAMIACLGRFGLKNRFPQKTVSSSHDAKSNNKNT